MRPAGPGKCLPLLALALLLPAFGPGRVVINEVCYDPAGADGGKEWIELYNAGDTDVNLQGARLLSGGAEFREFFTFPHYVLRARRFVLVGGEQVSQAVFHVPMTLQNGGAETDGVRYLGPDGFYTDTLLYDSPNSNNLPDDTGAAGTDFAPDVAEGNSLARRMDGYDTNNCAADFCEEAEPTPGLPNRVRADYALLHPQAWREEGSWRFGLWVKNLSDIGPALCAGLSVCLDGLKIAENTVSDLAAGDSLRMLYTLPVSDDLNHRVTAFLDLENDPDPSNNSVALDLFPQSLSQPRLNEVMFAPEAGKQEWIELWVESLPTRGDFSIRDANGNDFSFSLPGGAGYFVLCAAPEQFLLHYPGCPADAVVGTSGWAALNNDGDSILLLNAEGDSLDWMGYSSANLRAGVSLERQQNSGQQAFWRLSLDPSGSTPGRANSQSAQVPDFRGHISVQGSPCNPREGQKISLFHKLESPQNYVNCKVYDISGGLVRVLADNTPVSAEGKIDWDGRDTAGKIVPRGRYFFAWESRPSDGQKALREQVTAVIFY